MIITIINWFYGVDIDKFRDSIWISKVNDFRVIGWYIDLYYLINLGPYYLIPVRMLQ